MLDRIKALRLKDWLLLGGVLLCFISLFLPFGTGVTSQYQGQYAKLTPAYAFVFGASFHRTLVENNVIVNSEGALYRPAPTALVAWILLVLAFIGLIVALVATYVKKLQWGRFIFIGCGVFLVVSSILFFASTNGAFQAMVPDDPSTYTPQDLAQMIAMLNFKTGFGFIGTGVFLLLSGLLVGASGVLRLIKQK